MRFKTRDYSTILKGLESGALIHPGDWVWEVKKEIIPLKKELKFPEEPKIDKELQLVRDKLEALEALKELEKEEETEIIKEIIK